MASLDLDNIGTLDLEFRKQDDVSLTLAMKNPGSYVAITGASGTTTITVTCTNSFTAGEYVNIKDVSGMTDINGNHQITARDSTTFTIVLTTATTQTYIANGTAAEFDTNWDLSSLYTAKLDIKADKTGSALIALTESSGLTLGDGSLIIDLTSLQTDSLTAGSYFYDFEVTLTSTGVVSTIFEGGVTVVQDVTN